MQRLLNFWGVALYGKRQRGAGGARPAGLWFAAAATRRAARFLLWLAELLSAPFRCARLSKSAGRKPASIGCLRAGSLETRVNSGLADRSAGNTRKCWAGGQPLRKCPFYTGFRAGSTKSFVIVHTLRVWGWSAKLQAKASRRIMNAIKDETNIEKMSTAKA